MHRRMVLAIAPLAIGAVFIGGVVVLGTYVEHHAIDEAATQGITLTIDHTRLLWSGVHFENVSATTVQLPNAKIHVDLLASDWNMTTVVATGADVTIDGPVTPPNPAGTDKPVPASNGPATISVQSAHILWTHADGDWNVELTNVNGQLALVPEFRRTYTWTADVTTSYGDHKFGPFTGQFTHLNGEENVQLLADATDPTSESLSISNFAQKGPHRYELVVSQRPLSKIGIPLDMIGLKLSTDPKLNLRVSDTIDRTTPTPKSNGTFELDTEPIAIPGVPDLAAIAAQLSWSGNPERAMPITDQARFTVGPFHGPITGTIGRPEGAVVLNLAFVSGPVPCSKFSSADPLQNLLGSSPLGAIASLAGAKSNVTGDVKLTGSVQFDSRNPAARKISFAPVTTCGLSISLENGGN